MKSRLLLAALLAGFALPGAPLCAQSRSAGGTSTPQITITKKSATKKNASTPAPAPPSRKNDDPRPVWLGSLHVTKPVKTFVQIRDHHVVKQEMDYSCGAAALCTLINYYFGGSVNERDLLNEMLGSLSEADRKDRVENGFSMLDLRDAAIRHGFQAEGARLPLSVLPELPGPVMVYLEEDGMRHFAVFRGVVEDRVYLADPSRGNVRMDVRRFNKIWPGIVLVLGKEGMGLPSDHGLAVTARPPVRTELQTARSAVFRRR